MNRHIQEQWERTAHLIAQAFPSEVEKLIRKLEQRNARKDKYIAHHEYERSLAYDEAANEDIEARPWAYDWERYWVLAPEPLPRTKED